MSNWLQDRETKFEKTSQIRQLAITESTTDLVAMLDADGFFMHLNSAGYALLELDHAADISLLRMAGMFASESKNSFLSSDIPRAVRSGASHSELDIETRNGDIIPGSLVLIAHKDADDNLTHFSVILRDISAIRDAELERQKLIKQLHQSRKLETLGRLAGGVAHDFNNLMTVVMGYAELGVLNTEEGKSCRAELDVILDSAHKASRLSSQLLDFSSKQMIEPQILNLNEVLENSLKLIQSMMSEGITIKLKTFENLWPISIDRSQLEQIILNLSVNARDALNSRGIYTLSTENIVLTSEIATSIGLNRGGEYVRFLVSDTGCGIDKEILDQIFDPFFTTKEKGKGTGLGLSAVYGSVKQNLGTINVSSTPGEGTTFEILFPKSDQDEDQGGPDEDTEDNTPPGSGSEKILLVEDNTAVRSLLSRVLTGLGYSVMEAENGHHALEMIQQLEFCDLVISDIIMPKMNGMELYQELQKKEFPAKMLFMSGHTDELISPQQLVDCNITLLKKPFQSDKFARIIREVLDAPLSGLVNVPAARQV